jgi:hypothetical protein
MLCLTETVLEAKHRDVQALTSPLSHRCHHSLQQLARFATQSLPSLPNGRLLHLPPPPLLLCMPVLLLASKTVAAALLLCFFAISTAVAPAVLAA